MLKEASDEVRKPRRKEPTALHGDTWHGAAQSMRCLGGWAVPFKFGT